MRRQFEKLRADGPWAHDIVDLSKRELVSDVQAGPITGATRSRRLANLGHLFAGSIFGGPTYRMSSQKPYQESPRAWMHASSPAFVLTEVEFIAWTQERNPSLRGFLLFHFDEPPPGKCMATFSISVSPFAGATGGVTLRGNGAEVTIPVTQSINRSIDLVFEPPAGGPAEVGFIIEAGVQSLVFFFMTLGPAPLVFTPNYTLLANHLAQNGVDVVRRLVAPPDDVLVWTHHD
jgi:hypothetical protein